MEASNQVILALDVGEKRIGVATAQHVAGIASPLKTIDHTEDVSQRIAEDASSLGVTCIVIGLPRNSEGDDTNQTRYVRNFVEELKKYVKVPVVFQDEAGTSMRAEAELQARNKPYAKGDIDALAATYFLQDYLDDSRGNI